jgi:hypothetical protein
MAEIRDRVKRDLLVESVRADSDRAALLNALADNDWPSFFEQADVHGVTPLIAHRWQKLGILDRVHTEVRRRLIAAQRDNMERNQRIQYEVIEYGQLFNNAGIPTIVLKGWPLVEMLYEQPSLRLIADMDVLVPFNEAQPALRALEAGGLEPMPRNRDAWVEKHLPAYWRLNGREIIYPLKNMFDPDHPRSVEVHVRVWEANFRGLRLNDPAGIWGRSRTVDVSGHLMRIPSLTDMFVHLCVHWACHWIEREARLNQLVDVDRFMRKFGDRVDWPLALQISEAARVTRFVFAALDTAQRVLGTPLPPDRVMNRLRAASPAPLRRWIERHGVDDVSRMDPRRPSKRAAYRLTWLSAASLGEQLGIVRYALLPPPEFIMGRYRLKQRWQAIPYYAPYILSRAFDGLKHTLRR